MTFLGLLLRLYLMVTKNVYTDEVLYSEIPLKYHLIDIIQANHRVKDNGFLYYIYLKIFLLFTNNIKWLRLSNIPLYIIPAYYIFRLFEFLKYKALTLVPVFLYVFLTYFVYMNIMVSTYNLVILFAVMSIYYLFKLTYNNHKKDDIRTYIYLFISLIAGFYTNYSFIYVLFLLIPTLIYMFVIKKKNPTIFLIMFLLGLIFTVPVLWQILKNSRFVVSYAIPNTYKETQIYYFLCNLSDAILIRKGNSLSIIILGIIILYRVFWLFSKRYLNSLSIIIITSLLLSFGFIYYVNNYLSVIYFERAFWFIYLMIIFFVSDFLKLLKQQRKHTIVIVLIITLVIGVFFRFSNQYEELFVPGNVNDFVDYKQLITSLVNERIKSNTKNLVLIDNSYIYYPVLKYYFSDLFKNSNEFFRRIREYRKNVNIYKISNVTDLDTQTVKNDTTYVLFDPEPQYIKYLLESTSNIRSTIYVIDYQENDVIFKKIYSLND